MIPPHIAAYFDRCERGEATAQDYTAALAAVQAAFERNQNAASRKARSLRDDHFSQLEHLDRKLRPGCYMPRRERLNAMRKGSPYSDRQCAAAGDA